MTPAITTPHTPSAAGPLRVGALFAGYGGLDLAVEHVFGARTVWVSEIDPGASKILAARFPGAPNLGDVTAVDWTTVPPVDVLTGGSPCQDLSNAGKRAGMRHGTRSGLWAAMCDAVETIRPRFVVWENVRGALSAAADSAVEPCPICLGDDPGVTLRALGRVLGDLAELGYDAAWVGLRAADVGAPHARYRVFLLAWDTTSPTRVGGHPVDADPRGQAGQERAGLRPPAPPRDGRGLAARDRRTPHPTGPGAEPTRGTVTLLPTPAVNDMGDGKTLEWWDEWAPRQKSATGAPAPHGKSLAIEAQRMLPTPTTRDHKGHNQRGDTTCLTGALMPTPRASDGTHGGPNQHGSAGDLAMPAAVQPARFGQYAPAITRWEHITGTPAPDPTGKHDAPRLAPAFVEWLMGLPAGWVTDTDTTRSEQLRALGNGVVPHQAAEALRHLLAVHAAALGDTVATARRPLADRPLHARTAA
ncbi:DNA cytosine methyltransferase [Isoptericola sp. BMS4]|uniref:DNA cytosine methyltransferase n=1 Tax=Isoptericola sp. BMS4 TaxID=2527875 RepID=UPI00141FED66|nr:DNA (cytosine-5-)-methyltransferase [Isoptericola sp. BMS4]